MNVLFFSLIAAAFSGCLGVQADILFIIDSNINRCAASGTAIRFKYITAHLNAVITCTCFPLFTNKSKDFQTEGAILSSSGMRFAAFVMGNTSPFIAYPASGFINNTAQQTAIFSTSGTLGGGGTTDVNCGGRNPTTAASANLPFNATMNAALALFKTFGRSGAGKYIFVLASSNPSDGANFTATMATSHKNQFADAGVIVSVNILYNTPSTTLLNLCTRPCLYHSITAGSNFPNTMSNFRPRYKELVCFDVTGTVNMETSACAPCTGCPIPAHFQVNVIGTQTVLPPVVNCGTCVSDCGVGDLSAMTCKIGAVSGIVTRVSATMVHCNASIPDVVGTSSLSLSMAGATRTDFLRYEVLNCTNGTFNAPQGTGTCRRQADIVLAVDTSDLISDANFSVIAKFLYNLTLALNIAPDRQRIALVEYGKDCGGNGINTLRKFVLADPRGSQVLWTRNLVRCSKLSSRPLSSAFAEGRAILDAQSSLEVPKFFIAVVGGITDSATGFMTVSVPPECVADNANYESICKSYPYYGGCFLLNPYCYNDCQSCNTFCGKCDRVQMADLSAAYAHVITVAIGNADVNYLKTMASSPMFAKSVVSPEDLGALVPWIANITCQDIYSFGTIGNLSTTTGFSMFAEGSGFLDDGAFTVTGPNGHVQSFPATVSGTTITAVIPANVFTVAGRHDVTIRIGYNTVPLLFLFDIEAPRAVDEQTISPQFVPWILYGILGGASLCLSGLLIALCVLVLMTFKKKNGKDRQISIKVKDIVLQNEIVVIPLEKKEEVRSSVKRSMYFVGGKVMAIDWKESGMEWQSPIRGEIASPRSDKLFEEIQRRKLERRKKLLGETAEMEEPTDTSKKQQVRQRPAAPDL